MRAFLARTLCALAIAAARGSVASAAAVEVLHWWTSGGKAGALNDSLAGFAPVGNREIQGGPSPASLDPQALPDRVEGREEGWRGPD